MVSPFCGGVFEFTVFYEQLKFETELLSMEKLLKPRGLVSNTDGRFSHNLFYILCM